jgi:uncharacterized membrane protein
MCAILKTPLELLFYDAVRIIAHLGDSMILAYDVATAAVTAMMAGNEFAVAVFVHPQLRRLNPSVHAQTAAALATVLGRVMPAWYGLALVLLVGAAFENRPIAHGRGLLIASAAALWTATIVFTVTMLVPINNRIAKIDSESPYDAWIIDRDRWDFLHGIRVALLVVSVVLLFVGLLQPVR